MELASRAHGATELVAAAKSRAAEGSRRAGRRKLLKITLRALDPAVLFLVVVVATFIVIWRMLGLFVGNVVRRSFKNDSRT
jgi:hypothetical protein